MKMTFILSALVLGLAASPVSASDTKNGLTVGDCISDGFYGNEPNMTDGSAGGPSEQAPGSNAGNVVASQSPGPFKTLPDGSVVRGRSIGDYQQLGVSIPELCRIATGG